MKLASSLAGRSRPQSERRCNPARGRKADFTYFAERPVTDIPYIGCGRVIEFEAGRLDCIQPTGAVPDRVLDEPGSNWAPGVLRSRAA
jgi:hypothetical protein